MRGYINVNLGGENRGIKFGNRAILDVMAKHQVLEGLKFSYDLVVDLVYFGLLNNCMIKKADPDFTADDVAVWVDDLPFPKLLEIFQVFQKSYTGDEEPEKSTKKKTS